MNWPHGKILHGGGLSGSRFDDYVAACGPGLAPAMASSFITVGKRSGGFAPIAVGLSQWLAGEKKANRIPNVGFDLHDIATDGHTRTSNLLPILDGKRDVEFSAALSVLRAFDRPLLLRLGLEVTSDEYEVALFVLAYRRLAQVCREIAPNAALCWCIEPSKPADLAPWYPGDDVVDCCGVDLYARETFTGPLADDRGNRTAHGRSVDMATWARTHDKPLVVPETAPVGKGFSLGTTSAEAEETWAAWFAPWIDFVKAHSVAAFAFMSQPSWGGSNGWGSSKIGRNPFLAQRWRAFLSKPQIMNAP